jgi:hypothetical protein
VIQLSREDVSAIFAVAMQHEDLFTDRAIKIDQDGETEEEQI